MNKLDSIINDRKEMFEVILLNFNEEELLQFVKVTERLANTVTD